MFERLVHKSAVWIVIVVPLSLTMVYNINTVRNICTGTLRIVFDTMG